MGLIADETTLKSAIDQWRKENVEPLDKSQTLVEPKRPEAGFSDTPRIQTNRGNPVGDIVDGVCAALGQISAPNKLPKHMKQTKQGVRVIYHKVHPVIGFHFVTPDNLEVRAELDVRQFSREYMNTFFWDIRKRLDQQRLKNHVGLRKPTKKEVRDVIKTKPH